MKLIDLLVRELPKRGGWPNSVNSISQDDDGSLCLWNKLGAYNYQGYWKHPEGNGLDMYWCGENSMQESRDRGDSLITREQYEAALAASQQAAWFGEGLPPVGIKCLTIGEAGDNAWYECDILAHTMLLRKKVAVFQYGDHVSCSSEEWFKPISTEAGRKREDTKNAIAELCRASASNGHSADLIYDAIASGKIPGIKLGD